MQKSKPCTKCGKDKIFTAFNKDTRKQGNRDGTRSQCKDCEGIYRKRIEQALRNEVFLLLGNACKRCGFSDLRALQIDHIYGDDGNSGNVVAVCETVVWWVQLPLVTPRRLWWNWQTQQA